MYCAEGATSISRDDVDDGVERAARLSSTAVGTPGADARFDWQRKSLSCLGGPPRGTQANQCCQLSDFVATISRLFGFPK